MIPFRQVIENAKDIIVITKSSPLDSPGPEIVYVNKAFTHLTGYQPEEVIGLTPRILQGKNTDAETLKTVRKALEKAEPIRFEVINYAKNGREYWLDCSIIPLYDNDGNVTHFASIERDLTEAKELQAELEHFASHDPLTNILNRRGFFDFAKIFFNQYRRHQTQFGLMMFDIDHFKEFNDTYGHKLGDRVIKEFVNIIKANIRKNDVFARLGGDEFVLIVDNITSSQLEKLAQNLIDKVKHANICFREKNISLSASIGISMIDAEDAIFETLLTRCDQALYKAKECGRNCYHMDFKNPV